MQNTVSGNSTTALRVGILVAVGLAIAIFSILSIGNGSRFFTHTEIFKIHFERINGLEEGAPVALSGVRIGAVESIHFPADPRANYVIVTIWVHTAAARRIHANSLATITSRGLLGDKFVELAPGTDSAPLVRPGAVLPSQNPIDYEALLQTRGTGDLIANVMEIAGQLRILLDRINRGQGLLAQLARGGQAPGGKPELSLNQVHKTLTDVDQLSVELTKTMHRVNSGRGLAGAMLSNNVNGQQMLKSLAQAAASVRDTAQRMDALLARIDRGHGMVPQMVDNAAYANEVLGNLRQSSYDLRGILHKINTGQGTIGMMVNDPTLYYDLDNLVSGNGAAGWGMGLMRGLYGITHPFSSANAPLPNNRCGGAPAAINPAANGSAAASGRTAPR